MDDPFNLERFVAAQEKVYPTVTEELKAGTKLSHWMWFIFPQIEWLGRSEMAKRYAIKSLDEAMAYAGHPVLGNRLKECTELVIDIDGKSANDIFDELDDLKFRSSMTLFAKAAPHIDLFLRAINKYYDGEPDKYTIQILHDRPPPNNYWLTPVEIDELRAHAKQISAQLRGRSKYLYK